MRTVLVSVLATAILVGFPLTGTAQDFQAGGLYEAYSFEDGLALSKEVRLQRLTAWTFPFVLGVSPNSRTRLTVSSTFLRAQGDVLTDGVAGSVSFAGLSDVEGRFALEVVPGRLTVFATGALPRGNETLTGANRLVANALATDVLPLAARNPGTGGNLGGGFAAGLPVGGMALGVAASLTQFSAFQPLDGSTATFKPGNEWRIRAGAEGRVAARTYLRVAGIFSRRSDDEIGGTALTAAAPSYAGYLSVDQAVGRSALSVWAVDLFRSRSQVENGSLRPRGNLLIGGFRVTTPLSRSLSIAPRSEVRHSRLAATLAGEDLSSHSTTWRFGTEVRADVTSRLQLILEGDRTFGDIAPALSEATGSLARTAVRGYRLGIRLGIRP